MSEDYVIKGIERVGSLAQASKLCRFLNNPAKYVYALLLLNVVYPVKKREVKANATLFFGRKIKVLLPAATDIYLTGGKTHISEIRLAKFILRNLKPADTFLDIGAHYGYFSLLAAELVGNKGTVIAAEPAPATFAILKENAAGIKQMTVINQAVADKSGVITFFELPNLFSEYNTTDITQFEQEPWFATANINKVIMDATTIDELVKTYYAEPAIIKIDVEGGEAAVIAGGLNYLSEFAPLLVMEYLEFKRNNQPHREAASSLINLGYHPNSILDDGSLQLLTDIEHHLLSCELESDNIVFRKD